VERTFAWLSHCRAVLVRYDKLAERYLATVKLSCALLWFRYWYELDPTLEF
jgi:transposase